MDGKKRHRTQAFPGFFAAGKKKDEEAKTVNRLFPWTVRSVCLFRKLFFKKWSLTVLVAGEVSPRSL